MRAGGNPVAPELPHEIITEWGTAYQFGCHTGLYVARNRRTGAVMGPAKLLDDLLAEMRIDWGEAS